MEYVYFAIAGYFSGSVLFAYWIPKICCGVDVREVSADGNPGTANAFQYGGFLCGVCVILLELAKGFAPVFLAASFLNMNNLLFALVLAAPVIGHAYPLTFRGRGGKAIAVSFGVLLGLYPILQPLCLLIALYLFFSLVIMIRPHFYRSIITFLLFGVGTVWLADQVSIVCGCLAMAITVIAKHFVQHQKEVLEIWLIGKWQLLSGRHIG